MDDIVWCTKMALITLEVLNSTLNNATTVVVTSITVTDVAPSSNTVLFVSEHRSSALSVTTILWAIINVLIFFAIICGNTLTIIAVRTCRRLKSLISNLFILSLAISDLIVGLALPYHLTFYMGSNFGKSQELCLIRFYLIIFACCVSILTLIAIAVDRYIAIIYALHYRRFMTRRVALIIITFSWLTGATVAIIPMFWNHWSTASQCEFDEVLPPWYMAGVITPGFILIWVFMLLVYCRIMREASKHARQLRSTNSCGRSNSTQSDWKSVQVVLFIMGCFSICWLPYFIVACAQIFDIYETTSILYKAAFSLAMTNSSLNPIIYCWKNSNFRKAFSLLLRCKNPNNFPHNLDVSQYSIRSHYVPRQQSSNSMIVVAITPLTFEQQGTVTRNEFAEIQHIVQTSNMLDADELPTTMASQQCIGGSGVANTHDEEDNISIAGSSTACASCVLCRHLLRKSTRLKHNIIQKVIDDELAKYTPTRRECAKLYQNNNTSGKDFDLQPVCDARHNSLSSSL